MLDVKELYRLEREKVIKKLYASFITKEVPVRFLDLLNECHKDLLYVDASGEKFYWNFMWMCDGCTLINEQRKGYWKGGYFPPCVAHDYLNWLFDNNITHHSEWLKKTDQVDIDKKDLQLVFKDLLEIYQVSQKDERLIPVGTFLSKILTGR